MEKRNILKETFGDDIRWVNWEPRDVKGRTTKVPISPVNGRLASSTDPKTWTDYATAFARDPDHMGISFAQDEMLLGIDIDKCLKMRKIEHELKDQIADLILEADTYTEISPSKSGLHLFLKLTEPLHLIHNKKAPYEIYTKGRYFTVTNNSYQKEPKDIRVVSADEALRLLGIIGYPWDAGPAAPDQRSAAQPEVSLDDDLVLKKMFRSKNGADIKKLYEGDITAHNNDASSADMALMSHLAFWTRKDAVQMERIWMASQLGAREKTEKRQDYRTRTINAAIKSCKEVYKSRGDIIDEQNPGLDLVFVLNKEKEKVYPMNTENMCRILRKHPYFAGRLRYDMFKTMYEIRDGEKWRSFEDNDAIVIMTKISVLFPFFGMVRKGMIEDAMTSVAKENSIDSALDFMKSLVWDKKNRLDTWLTSTIGTPDDAYHRAVASNWIKGMIKRVVEPGCKFDYVLVLEGPQGSRKSSLLNALGGIWYVETAMSTESKDFFMMFISKLLIEFSEGETLSRTEVKRMKAIITTQSDRYRIPYDKNTLDFPRRCVFAMTTNQEEYLKDETGNRRWLPVTMVKEEADVEWMLENREQIFAEAYHRVVNLKEKIYEFPKEETLAAQSARRIQDPNTEVVCDWYNNLKMADRMKGITVGEAYKMALHEGFPGGKPMSRSDQMSIADIFKTALKLERRRVSEGGEQVKKWYPKSEPERVPIPMKDIVAQED